ncbi:hypothetical protein BJ165DRAFT_1406097 [Panaeolus papilionaceus]|nr:hypothetical protein BJ165DRAFT_1406097 [Panaeolus papilionaceus]
MRLFSFHRDDISVVAMRPQPCRDAVVGMREGNLGTFGLGERRVEREEGAEVQSDILGGEERGVEYTAISMSSDHEKNPKCFFVFTLNVLEGRAVLCEQVAVPSHSSTRTNSSTASPSDELLYTTQWLTKAYLPTMRREGAYSHPNTSLTHITPIWDRCKNVNCLNLNQQHAQSSTSRISASELGPTNDLASATAFQIYNPMRRQPCCIPSEIKFLTLLQHTVHFGTG